MRGLRECLPCRCDLRARQSPEEMGTLYRYKPRVFYPIQPEELQMSRPFRVAIVGTGPAGMYSVEHLLLNTQVDVEIDLFERLPVPWGLVRYGVAPDHPEKKLISNRLFNNLISRDNVRFFGNVEIGKDVQVAKLLDWYDSVIFASGATSDNKLGISGEELSGSWPASEFVAWYNGHPDYSHLEFDLSCKRAVIIGNGNVALDIARILCLPIDELEKTDIADHALNALRKSKIEDVVILGRRSCANAAFNNPELEELAHLDDVNVTIDDPNFETILSAHMDKLNWENRRKVVMLQNLSQRRHTNASKSITFKFVTSAVEITGNQNVEAINIARNTTEISHDGQEQLLSRGEHSSIDTGLIFRAIGYRGSPFPGLPFDSQRGVIENENGRITEDGKAILGGYVTGWIKRGPRGVIGTNKRCSGETVASILEDQAKNALEAATLTGEAVLNEIKMRKSDFVSLSGWTAIDRAEKQAGQRENRTRKKLCNTDAMLDIARA